MTVRIFDASWLAYSTNTRSCGPPPTPILLSAKRKNKAQSAKYEAKREAQGVGFRTISAGRSQLAHIRSRRRAVIKSAESLSSNYTSFEPIMQTLILSSVLAESGVVRTRSLQLPVQGYSEHCRKWRSLRTLLELQ